MVIENKAYLFGGRSPDYHNDFRVFNLSTQTWSALHETGKNPTKRYGASAVAYGNKIIVFGGYDTFSSFCDDLFEFDISNCQVVGYKLSIGKNHILLFKKTTLVVFLNYRM